MPSVKLTTYTREIIATDIIYHKFTDPVAELVREYRALAGRVYDHAYSAADQAIMKNLRDGWLPKSDDITVEFAGEIGRARLRFDGRTNMLRSGKISSMSRRAAEKIGDPGPRLVPYKANENVVCVVGRKEPLWRKMHALEWRRDKLKKEIEELYRSVDRTIRTFNTTKQLIEGWPQIEVFVRRHEGQKVPERQLPSIPVQLLNEQLDLPPKQEAA